MKFEAEFEIDSTVEMIAEIEALKLETDFQIQKHSKSLMYLMILIQKPKLTHLYFEIHSMMLTH